jgi:hypothetical protein
MTEGSLRGVVSIFLIVAHVAILGLVLVLGVMRALTATEFTTALSIIVPMLGALTGLAVSYIISAKTLPLRKAHSVTLSGIYVFASLLFPVAFVIAIGGLVLMKAANTAGLTLEQFKMALTGTETIFGAYTGKLLGSLFEKESRR